MTTLVVAPEPDGSGPCVVEAGFLFRSLLDCSTRTRLKSATLNACSAIANRWKKPNRLVLTGTKSSQTELSFYLWPSAEGSKFQFIFRPRFGIRAMSAPSVLYDYYNPEANAAVFPLRFNVR